LRKDGDFLPKKQEIAHFGLLDIQQLVSYTLQYDMGSAIKRMGWALEAFGISMDFLDPLQNYPVKNNYLLDIRGSDEGEFVRRWNIIQNLGGGLSNND